MNSEDKENSETGNTSYKCTLYHFSNERKGSRNLERYDHIFVNF